MWENKKKQPTTYNHSLNLVLRAEPLYKGSFREWLVCLEYDSFSLIVLASCIRWTSLCEIMILQFLPRTF